MALFQQDIKLFFVSSLAALLAFVACKSGSQDQRTPEERTRDEAAKATERAKPVIEATGRKIGEVAHSAAEEARAAAQGVRDGWNNAQSEKMNLNSASERQLLDLGISEPQAREIISRRPYRDPHELVTRRVLSNEEYLKIRNRITTK